MKIKKKKEVNGAFLVAQSNFCGLSFKLAFRRNKMAKSRLATFSLLDQFANASMLTIL